jgi:hypothetical protein
MSERTALVSVSTLAAMDEMGILMNDPVFLDLPAPDGASAGRWRA